MYQFEPKCNLLRSTLQVKQQVSEAVVLRFLKIRKLQRKTCVWVSCPATLLKETSTQVLFCKIYKISKNSFFIRKLQWLLLRFNSCFQRSPGQKPMRLSPIHTRFRWKRYLLPRKSKSSYYRCSVKEDLQLYWKRLQYYETIKNTYLEKHL